RLTPISGRPTSSGDSGVLEPATEQPVPGRDSAVPGSVIAQRAAALGRDSAVPARAIGPRPAARVSALGSVTDLRALGAELGEVGVAGGGPATPPEAGGGEGGAGGAGGGGDVSREGAPARAAPAACGAGAGAGAAGSRGVGAVGGDDLNESSRYRCG